MANSAHRQVSIFINGQQAQATAKDLAAAYRKASNELATMVIGSDEYIAKLEEVKTLNKHLDDHRKSLKGVADGYKATAGGLGDLVGLTAGAFAADAIISYGAELFRLGGQLEATEKKAKRVFGEALPQVTREANANAEAMGLTTSEYTAAAAAIQDLLVPMGFQRKQAAEVSTELVNLAGALSEWTGGQISSTQVTEILSDALLGERESLKQLGIQIDQAAVDAELAARGQEDLTGTLRQQAEAVATLDLILRKSTDAQAEFAEGAGSIVRQSAELSARFKEIKENLAQAFIPIGAGFLNSLREASNYAGEFQGKVQTITAFFGLGGGTILQRLFGTKEEVQELSASVLELLSFNTAGAFIDPNAVQRPKNTGFQLAGIDPAQREFLLSEAKKLQDQLEKDDEAAGKRRADKAKQRAIHLQNELQQLIEAQSKARLDFDARQLDDELAIAIRAIEQRYDVLIQKAITLEKAGVEEATAQRIALEHLKNEEIAAAVEADLKKAIEKNTEIAREGARKVAQAEYDEAIASQEFLAQRQREREEAQRDLDAFRNDALLTDQQNEVLQLEQHYLELLAIADDYGLDVTSLQEAYLKKKQEVIDKYAKEEIEKQKQAAEELANAQREVQLATVNALSEGASALAGFFDESSDAGKALFLFQKGLAIAELIINLQKEIAGYAAAAAPLGIAGAPILAAQSLAAKIRTGTGIATILATTIKTLQKAEGGYLDVVGADDNRHYHAAHIAPPSTGLLPSFPVLFRSNATGAPVLASERGAEYFVASEDLRNPYVANLVHLIDLATQAHTRVPQFAEGGVNATTPATVQTTVSSRDEEIAVMRALTASLLQLQRTMAGGIFAVLPDSSIVDAHRRLKKINAAADGLYE